MDEALRRRLQKIERALRPRAVAAIRQADQIARAVDALERATAAMEAAVAELAERALPVTPVPTPPAAPSNHDYDEQTLRLMHEVLRPQDSCVDVGANEGLILDRIVDLSPEGRHFAFEPIPTLAAQLRARFPDVEIHEVALAAEEGTSTFHHVVLSPFYSGLRERRYDTREEAESVELIAVRTARLDDILPADVDVRFVKIDVEGGEEGVIRGGLKTLERCRPYVVFEHGLGASEYYGTEPETVYDLLRSVDLRVTLLERYLAHEPSLSRDEFSDQYHHARNYYFLAHP